MKYIPIVTIQMKRDWPIGGPEWLKAGEEYELPIELVDMLVSRKFGRMVYKGNITDLWK